MFCNACGQRNADPIPDGKFAFHLYSNRLEVQPEELKNATANVEAVEEKGSALEKKAAAERRQRAELALDAAKARAKVCPNNK